MTATLERPTEVLGRTEPRLWTRPLVAGLPGPCGCGCALTAATSLGFEAIEFATEVLGVELLPWQRWWLIHALELRPDGGYRFRTLLTLIARQNGKTTLLKIVALWAMYMGRAELVLGAAQSLDIARESWAGAVALARGNAELAAEIDTVRKANGEQCLTLTNGARYRITAATDEAGRGLSVDLLVLDELRAQRDTGAWAALSKTTSARPDGLIVGISNAGSDQSVVLNTLRSAALAETEPTLGIFEWSAPDGCELDDMEACAQANPALGRTLSVASVRTSLATDPAEVYRTEVLCQHVDALDSALDAAGWKAGADPAGSLASVRARVVAVVDVAPDGGHVTLAGAAVLDDGRVRVEAFAAWTSTEDARRELGELVGRIGPAVSGWFPSGPAAALAPELRALGAVEIKGQQVYEACQGLADLVLARRVLHPADPLLDAHVAGAQRMHTGDGWRFARRGAGHVDAVYAVAGAVYLARTLPAPDPDLPRPRIF